MRARPDGAASEKVFRKDWFAPVHNFKDQRATADRFNSGPAQFYWKGWKDA